MVYAVLFAIIYYILGIIWLARIIISYIRIRDSRANVHDSHHVHIDILLPVLEEEYRLESFIDYFESAIKPIYPEFTIWIITTEQEAITSLERKTWTIADNLVAMHRQVKRLHYPAVGGVMAHQLNYALKNINSNGIFAIYNADSQPDPLTFEWVSRTFKKLRNTNIIFQQYGNYLKNFKAIQHNRWNKILLANGFHQNRCTMGYEYYKATRGLGREGGLFFLRPINYCIGHGLFITPELGRAMMFSETSRNEDCAYGLEATWRQIPIVPIPYFDTCDSTRSVSSLYYQKSNWFFGPFQAFLYYRLLLFKYGRSRSLSLVVFSAKLFMQSIGWIFWPLAGTIIMIYGCYVAIFSNFLIVGLMLFFALPFYLIPTSMVANILMRKLQHSVSTTILPSYVTAFISIVLGATLNYLISGIAGLRGLLWYRAIRRSFKGRTPSE